MAETASRYKKRLAATLRGGFTPACINDTEIPPPYAFTPCSLRNTEETLTLIFPLYQAKIIVNYCRIFMKLHSAIYVESNLRYISI